MDPNTIPTMSVVRLRGPLRKLAGDRAEHELAGDSVAAVLQALEERHPDLQGWVLDERGRIRRHLHVFVNGELGEEATGLEPGDRVDIVQAITGG